MHDIIDIDCADAWTFEPARVDRLTDATPLVPTFVNVDDTCHDDAARYMTACTTSWEFVDYLPANIPA